MSAHQCAVAGALALALAGSAFAQQAPTTSNPSTAKETAAKETAAKETAAKPALEQKSRCVRETHVGTIIGQRICRTAAEREADRLATSAVVDAGKESVRQFTGGLLNVPSAGTLDGIGR